MSATGAGRRLRLLIVGGVSNDTITTAQGESHLQLPGGNAVYAAVGARVWGVETAVVGLVGEGYPRSWIDELASADIDVSSIQRVIAPHQSYFAVRYRSDGDREPYVPIEAFEAAGVPLPQPLRRTAALLTGPYGAGWRASDETRDPDWRADPAAVPPGAWAVDGFLVVPAALDRQLQWLRTATARLPRSAVVFLDPEEEQGRVLSEDDLRPLLADADVTMPSLRQLAGLLDGDDVAGVARRLAAHGPSTVAVKMGEAGCLVYDAATDAIRQIPAYPTDVRDPTGAGDAFCGGFAAGYLLTGDAGEAARYGTVSASFAIEQFGALAGLRFSPSDAAARLATLQHAIDLNAWTTSNGGSTT